MQVQKRALWLFLILLAALAVVANPSAFAPTGFLAIRAPLIQVTGFLAVGSMCAAIVLSLRPRWAEKRLGGLDKAYRLHRSLGIAALVFAISHWIVTQAPGWLQALGVRLERHGPGTPPHVMGELELLLRTQRSLRGSRGCAI